MANPFKVRFNSECNSCGNHREEGELMYAVDGMFVCGDCAKENGNVCPKCEGFKKEEYDVCYECSQKERGEPAEGAEDEEDTIE